LNAGAGMTAKPWRDRLIYAAASLFLAWHTVAIMLAPVPPNNEVVRAFRTLFHPYLTLLGLDATWDFFSPIGGSDQFRYRIEGADGNEYTFTPIAEVNWLIPVHRWNERMYEEIIRNPEIYGHYYARFFCHKHAALRPVAISLIDVQEQDFWPEDFLRGKDRVKDPDYFAENTLLRVACTQK
jgi:hypothetical protein